MGQKEGSSVLRRKPFARNTDNIEFDFFLAERLGRTVQELHDTISNREYNQWVAKTRLESEREERAAIRARNQGRG